MHGNCRENSESNISNPYIINFIFYILYILHIIYITIFYIYYNNLLYLGIYRFSINPYAKFRQADFSMDFSKNLMLE